MAAASMVRQTACNQSKPSLALKSQHASPLNLFSIPSRVSFGAKSEKGLVVKCWVAAAELNSRVAASNDRGIKNPIIVIDNYDSFTYNLCQYMGEVGCHFEVYRNDELTVEDLKRKKPRGVLISPGPGTPQDSGISLQTVLELGPTVPLFGVCMGLQCIGEAFGGKIVRSPYGVVQVHCCVSGKIVRSPYGVVHGKGSTVYYDEKGEDAVVEPQWIKRGQLPL